MKSKDYDYIVRIKRKGSKFILFIEELFIIVEDESLENAYSKIEEEKNKRIKEFSQSGLITFIPMKKEGLIEKKIMNSVIILEKIILSALLVIIIFQISFFNVKINGLADKINELPGNTLKTVENKVNAFLPKSTKKNLMLMLKKGTFPMAGAINLKSGDINTNKDLLESQKQQSKNIAGGKNN